MIAASYLSARDGDNKADTLLLTGRGLYLERRMIAPVGPKPERVWMSLRQLMVSKTSPTIDFVISQGRVSLFRRVEVAVG